MTKGKNKYKGSCAKVAKVYGKNVAIHHGTIFVLIIVDYLFIKGKYIQGAPL